MLFILPLIICALVNNVDIVASAFNEIPFEARIINQTVWHDKYLSAVNMLHKTNERKLSFFGSPLYFNEKGKVTGAIERALIDLATMYLPSPELSSPSCQAALANMSTTLWGFRMVDSWGKFPDGLLLGNYQADGMFDQCVRTRSPDNSVRGKYCKVSYTRSAIPTSIRPDPRLAQVSVVLPVYFGTMVYGTCIPHSCTDQELRDSIQGTLLDQKRQLQYVDCQEEQKIIPSTPGDVSLIVFLSVVGTLMVAGAIIDIYILVTNNKTIQQGPLKYVMPFSLYSNLGKLFHVTTQNPPGTITCLYGLRVLSMTWVMFAHQHSLTLGHTSNFFFLENRTDGLLFQIIINGDKSTDSFFFMSGLLVSYLTLKEVKKTGGKFNAGIFYLHRIIRLTPAIGLVCWFMGTLSKYFISGPYARDWDSILLGCYKYWWRDILYVSNLVTKKDDPSEIETECLGQCWYTSLDTQLYLISPLLTLPLYFYPKTGKAWLFGVTLVSLIIPAAIIYVNELPPVSLMTVPSAYGKLIYLAPWSRAAAWIVGLWLGYVLHTQGNKTLKLPHLQVAAGWTIATVSACLVLVGMWSYNTFSPLPYDPLTQVVYGGLHRAVWCACLAWMVFACHNGYGGMVNGFLSHPSWQPLSRITYAMFLVSLQTQIMIVDVAREPNYYTHLGKIIETCGAILICGIGAILVTLIAEIPVLGLEKLLLRRPGRDQEHILVPREPKEPNGLENHAFNSHEMVEEGKPNLHEKSMSHQREEDTLPHHYEDTVPHQREEGTLPYHCEEGTLPTKL